MTLKIYGYSDDLIEVEGDIVEEFNYGYDVDHMYVALSNGMVLSAHFGDGWTIKPVIVGGGVYELEIDENGDQSVTVHGKIDWVVTGDRLERR